VTGWHRDDDDAPWVTGNYDSGDPAADADARQIFLARQARLGQGWHRRRWAGPDGAELSRQLDGQMDDPVTREERSAADRLTGREALRRLAVAGNPGGERLSGSRALDLIRQLEIGAIGHEPGCRP
jgi:hypothetical protein